MLSVTSALLLASTAPLANAWTSPSTAGPANPQRQHSFGARNRGCTSRSSFRQPARRGGGLAPLRYEKDDSASEEEAERLANLDAQLTAFLGASSGSAAASSAAADEVMAPKAKSSKRAPKSKLALQDEAVPESQQPAQELEDLKEAPFFSMAALDDEEFLKKLGYVYGALFVFPSLPISLITYPLFQAPIQAILSANLGAVLVTFLFLIRLYVGWSYVGDRLEKDVGYYEESGWYDGYLSVKPPEIRQRDQLLFKFEVSPALERVKKFTLLGGGALVASVMLFNTAAPSDPYEYLSEDYLQRVRQDDAAAMREGQRTASGKPTYCDSRYYKAVAGGNGC